MKDKESVIPADWFHKGDLDLRRVEILLENDDPEGAAFHLQQALEKYLKGYLISKGWKLQKTHDLEDLLDYAVDFNKGFEGLRGLCQEVTEYYMEERYPFMISSHLTGDEVRSRLETAKLFISRIKEEM